MSRYEGQVKPVDAGKNSSPESVPSIDADESGALAIGLMIAIVCLVALLTLALFISIP